MIPRRRALRCDRGRLAACPRLIGHIRIRIPSPQLKRAAEAYNILRKPALRKRYDAELSKGKLTFDMIVTMTSDSACFT